MHALFLFIVLVERTSIFMLDLRLHPLARHFKATRNMNMFNLRSWLSTRPLQKSLQCLILSTGRAAQTRSDREIVYEVRGKGERSGKNQSRWWHFSMATTVDDVIKYF